MFSAETIRSMQREAASEAARQGKTPVIIDQHDLDDGRIPQIPFIGDYVPAGWTKLDKDYFVDSSGFGSEGEGALTMRRFLATLVPGHGYAVTEAGQFQVHVGEFIKEV